MTDQEKIEALDIARKDMTVVACRLGERVQELTCILRELDSLRKGCSDDELGAIVGLNVAQFVTRYRLALAQ